MLSSYKNKVIVFFSSILFFSVIYFVLMLNDNDDFTYDEAFFISASYQTLCGTNLEKYPKKIRRIATLQMIISYLIIANIFYYFVNLKKIHLVR